MKLNPQQAPLYGECVLTVQLDDAEACCTEEEEAAEQVEFYLLFSGSNQRHLTTTLRLSQVTLQAVCPAHDVCEQVLVTLCSARPTGQVDPHSQERFYYVQDLALDMAHFLLNNTASEGALLLDEQQVPLKECEKLDHSLALALKHLTWRRHDDDTSLGTAHNKDTDNNNTQRGTTTHADAHNKGTRLKTHPDAPSEEQPGTRADVSHADAREDTPGVVAVTDGHGYTETPADVWTDASADLENGIDLSQCQQQESSSSTLLHFAASRGLRKVAQFLLQEPGGTQALRRADARGETPACLAQRNGHRQLSELFTRFETLSPNPWVEPADQQPHIHLEGRALQHHPNLGTYTLTLPAHREGGREGGETVEEAERERTANGTRRLLQEEVEELRGLIQRHRDQAVNEGHRDVGTPTAAFPRLSSSNQEPGSPVFSRTQSCSNGRPEDNKAERRGSEVTDKQGSPPPPVEEIKDGVVVASAPAISVTSSCATGSRRHHRHDKNTEQEAVSVSALHNTTARGRKHRKRTTKKHGGAKNGANDHKETSEAAVRNPAENTGSNAGIVGTPLPTEPVAVAVVGCEEQEEEEEGSTRRTAGGGGPGEEGTPIPSKALSGPCSRGEGKWDGWRPVVVDTTTTAVEKQEGASLKLGLGASEGEAAETLTETNNKADVRPAREGAQQGPASGHPATQRRAMGQAQSQDSQSDQGETTQPDAGNQSPQLGQQGSPKSPGTAGKPRRPLWRDGSDLGIAPDWREKEAVSQTVWYDGGGDDSENVDLQEQTSGQSKERGGQSSVLLDVNTQQPLQHGLSSAVSQPRASGTQPQPSHGPGAQRQEVHRTQQREEERVEEEEEEGGGEEDGRAGGGPGREVEGSRQALDKDSSVRRASRNRRESTEAEEREEEIGDEKGGSEERGEEKEGRRKRRRKRGKKGAREAKLSSSSSVESQNQTDAQSHTETERERQAEGGGGGGPRPGRMRQAEVRQTDTEAKTGSVESQAPSSTESVLRKEADACGMHLPSQTEEGRDSPGLARSLSIADPAGAVPEVGQTGNNRGMESTETVVAGASESEELPPHDAVEPVEWKDNDIKPVELGTLSGDAESIRLAESKDCTVADEKLTQMEATGYQEGLPLKPFGHGERTKGRNLTEPPEFSKLNLDFVDSTEPTTSAGTLGSVLETVDYGESPECNVTAARAASPVSPVRPVEHVECVQTGAVGCEERVEAAAADGLLFEGTTDASPMFPKQEGSGETSGREYPEHCCSAGRSLSAGQSEGNASEGKTKADRESEVGIIREGTGEGKQNEERAGEENKGMEKEKGEELLVIDTEEREAGRGEEMGKELNFTVAEKEQRYAEELAATSVAVVTVAIASAIANIELANLFAGNNPDAGLAQALTEQASVPPLVNGRQVDTEVPAETKNRLTNESHAGLTYPDAGQVVESDIAMLTTRSGKEETLAHRTDTATLLSHSDTRDTKDNALPSQTESQLPARSDSPTHAGFTEQAGAESSTKLYIMLLEQPDTEAIGPVTIPEDQLPACSHCEVGREASGTSAQATVTPLTNDAVTAEPGGHDGTVQEDDSPRACPVVDTGQDPPTDGNADAPVSPNDKTETEGRRGERAEDGLGPLLEENHSHTQSEVEGNLCTSASDFTTESELGRHQVHDGADHVIDVHNSVCKGEAMDAEEERGAGVISRDSEECKGDVVHPSPPRRWSESNFGDFAHVGDVEPSQPALAGTGLVVSDPVEVGSDGGGGGGTLWCQGDQASAVDSMDGMSPGLQTLDTVDGWKERERARVKEEEEDGSKSSQEDPDRSTAVRQCPPHLIESLLEIQRETYRSLAEPCATTTTGTSLPCTDLHSSVQQHREDQDRVSVCSVLQTDAKVPEAQRATVTAELDDSVFKKPYPVLDHRERGVRVSWSSTDDTPAQSTPTTDPTTSPWSCSGGEPWKSETEEAGGGGGEDEERKDQLSENPLSSAILRASIRSLSPLRRHSWEPGRNNGTGEMDASHRSSLRSLPVEVKRTKPPLHRRSMSWCPSSPPAQEPIDNRSYSLEGLEVERGVGQTSCPSLGACEDRSVVGGRGVRLDSQERGGGSLVSLTEEQEGDASSIDSQKCHHRVLSMTSSCPAVAHHQPLTKSISMVTISQRELEAMGRHRSKRRISFALSFSPLLKSRSFFSIGSSSSDEEELGGRAGSFSSTTGSLEYSISEEEPGPLRSDSDVRIGVGGTKVSRTFSYLRSKMSKKNKEKDKERRGEKEREVKEKEKKPVNGHVFSPVSPSPPSTSCQQCAKPLNAKEAFFCNNCGAHVHKSCRESLSACAKSRTKQSLVPEAAPGSAVNMRTKSTSSASSTSSTSSCRERERWSTLPSPVDQITSCHLPRRQTGILSFNTHSNLSKSISTSNIAGLEDERSLKGLKFLSQSTDSLHKGSKVNASTESLTDEGTEMMDNQLMGEFECELKDLEADSWSATVDKKFLKLHKKDEVKRQDVIYELYQTEFHHVRTLRIMADVYYKGIQKELQLDSHTLDKVFPMLEELSDLHTHFLTLLLERKRASQAEGRGDSSFLIRGIGEILVNQFSGSNAERMKKVYGKFCSRHNEAVALYKELLAKDKRFQAFIKRIMSSSIVRRLSIPECILLVTQRITKYPVLIQRILQHTKDTDEDYSSISDALRFVKEIIAAVDSKVNEQEKKRRLREVYSRTDSKSIMCMKSGQMFAKEDLIRGRRLMHDGALQLKNSTGRLKDVQAMLLSDVLVFLQEKDQKYIFASLDQRSTVISLQKLIVREVANEERGLFLITAGTTPEMVEVLASSKDERNTWMTIIQDAMHCMEKEEDEGVPSETEEDRRLQENRAKEIRALLRRKDDQIVSLLEEKVLIFRDLCDCSSSPEDSKLPIRERMFFRATPDEVTKGEPIMRDAMREVETLHGLVNTGLGGAGCSTPVLLAGGGVGPVCLPRRAETFGGFDSHQMNCSKNGDKEEGDDSLDLRRTESDSVLKKGATTSLQMLLKRSNEQVNQSVTHLHDLLTSLQAVVVQQDSFIEDQRQALSERLATASSSRHSSSSSLSSCSSSRPPSLIEQEKQRSLERQRQEAASLQKQQAAHQEERRKREKEWEVRDRTLVEREDKLTEEEREAARRRREVEEDGEDLHRRKEDLQRDLERLKESQRRLERDKEALRRETERMEAMRREESSKLQRYQRTPSTTSEDSLRFHSSGSLDHLEPRETPSEHVPEVELLSSSAPTKEPFLRIGSKRLSKNFFSSSKPQGGGEKESQLPSRLLQLTKPKDKKDKKKKKGKGGDTEGKATVMAEPQSDGDIFC